MLFHVGKTHPKYRKQFAVGFSEMLQKKTHRRVIGHLWMDRLCIYIRQVHFSTDSQNGMLF